jgi:UDP-glucose:(heptosyl)LPS alpha-1,3-glucosyltransferase
VRVALVSIRFDTRGGSERRTYQLAKGLIGAGHDVEIFAAEVSDMDLEARVNLVPAASGPSFLRVKSFTRNVGRALAGRSDIDVVHNQIRPFTDGVVTVGGGCHKEYLDKVKGPLSVLNPLNCVVLGMEKKMYRPGGCAAVITNSEYAKHGLLKHYPMPPERVFVAYNGVDLEKFSPKTREMHRLHVRLSMGLTDEPLALFMGTGFERKGLRTAIEALKIARGMEQDIRRLKLLVAGKDDPAPYKKIAGRLGVADGVIFAGETKEPEKLYAAADIFVLPTRYDPFSNAVLEAMACGLPSITTKENGLAEIIKDGEDGFVMRRPDDSMGMAASLAYLSCEKAREEVGFAARNKAKGFTWDKTLGDTLEVYGLISR